MSDDADATRPGPGISGPPGRSDLESRVMDLAIRLAVLGVLVFAALQFVLPLAGLFAWAAVLAVALHPVHAVLRRGLGGRGGLAAALLTAAGLLVILGPAGLLVAGAVESLQTLIAALESGSLRVPPPPARVLELPVVGERLHAIWSLAAASLEDAARQYGPALLPAGGRLMGRVAGLGGGLAMFALSMILAGFLFGPGPKLVAEARRIASGRLTEQGAHLIDLAGATIRNVSRGVIGVALLQALVAGLVLYVAEVPGAGLIAAGVLVLAIVQVGPAPVLAPVIVWVWIDRTTAPALALTLALVMVAVIDNVLKPIVMARGLETPMVVILLGVIGGVLAHGLIGLFLGPVVLSVVYELARAWSRTPAGGAEPPTGGG